MTADDARTGPGGATDFDAFIARHGRRVRQALVAYYGPEIGNEAADEALATAWERWATIRSMDNAVGYVFRIGQTKARPHVRWRTRHGLFPATDVAERGVDVPGLVDLLQALDDLEADQRTAVVMVKSLGYSHRDVALLLEVSESVVNNLVHRGLLRLRVIMGAHA